VEAGSRARAIAEYNRQLLSHAALDTAIIPIRDGVAVSRLKANSQ
jgi:predicted O-methyltransferase YrrM